MKNQEFARRLENIISHLTNAADDAREGTIADGVPHAVIAQGLLNEALALAAQFSN